MRAMPISNPILPHLGDVSARVCSVRDDVLVHTAARRLFYIYRRRIRNANLDASPVTSILSIQSADNSALWSKNK